MQWIEFSLLIVYAWKVEVLHVLLFDGIIQEHEYS